jgi:alanine dehydrogenase
VRPRSYGIDLSLKQNAYVLSDTGVAELFASRPLAGFIADLMRELEVAYLDPALKSILRIGWTDDNGDTVEIMGSQTADKTCVKIISSNPSVASRNVPVVSGTLVSSGRDLDRLNQAMLVCDSSILTALRTAASTALVLRKIKPHVSRLGVIGAGHEGFSHALVLALMCEDLTEIVFADTNRERATATAVDLDATLREEGLGESRKVKTDSVRASDKAALAACDAIVTATYGSSVVLDAESLRDGTFIAAVGADLEGKRELADDVYGAARFVADDLGQCMTQGELQHAAGQLDIPDDEVARLRGHGGELLDGRIIGVVDLLRAPERFAGRSEPLVVYDSTGFSGQDLAMVRALLPVLKQQLTPSQWNPPEWVSGRRLLGRG